ncbi:hypothetical protein TRIATDRAFT_306763 [Trichoderma atroviride IMI 206040]|uniref:Uncharacterized protein n=1 Tax=Hypocrea atroviridis (strain ATCC 20476 / IMI 206040) TaxID=452589 RepID=G9NR65_HYPAI|nr:uncharacterized protein TRIATDRAFT_306763 [Trichoderma atroviride IMI 206040]EHK47034.1 hypothetical protein TRIATDRAFT_306763 [Trichoderma atroviride IMI 206040]
MTDGIFTLYTSFPESDQRQHKTLFSANKEAWKERENEDTVRRGAKRRKSSASLPQAIVRAAGAFGLLLVQIRRHVPGLGPKPTTSFQAVLLTVFLPPLPIRLGKTFCLLYWDLRRPRAVPSSWC